MSETKVLLVDDNPKYLKDALPFYGYNVTAVTDGLQALNLLEKKCEIFDIILLDVMMPKMNGWETLKNIRKSSQTKHIPVIMITAVNEEQKMISGLKIGADDYIVKPFILPNLLARMEAVLRRSSWQQSGKESGSSTDSKPKTTLNKLTSREKEVLKLVTHGADNKTIAEQLVLREVTVKTHLNSIFKKLNVKNRTQAVLLALNTNLIN